jgi:hypothetical protein
MKRLAPAALVLLVIASAAPAWQQPPVERVQFPRGRTTAVLSGRADTAGRHYLLRARAGQRMIVHLTSPKKDIHFQVVPAREGGQAIESSVQSRDWEGDLPETGDYYVSVFANKGAGDFTLEITIRGAGAARASSPPAAPACGDFSGTYDTAYGPMTLTRTGNTVRGNYGPEEVEDSNTIEGTVTGNVLTGRWRQPDSRGTFRFTLSKAGRGFTGTFTTDGDRSGRGQWNGTCAGADRQ